MLATLAKSPPAGDRWLHEIKFDGYRLEARIEDGRVTLWTRSGLDWTEKFGDGVVDALRNLPLRNALIDGELAVENKSGASEFSLLQADLSEGRHDRFVYYAFDCLYLDGFDLREAALIRRKALLDELIGTGARPAPLQLPLRGGRRAGAGARLRARSRGHRLQAQRLRLSVRPRQELGEVQVFGPAGVRHRRLRSFIDRAQGGRRAGSGRLRRPCPALRRTRRDRLFRSDRRSALCSARGDAHSRQARSRGGSARPKPARFVSFGPS